MKWPGKIQSCGKVSLDFLNSCKFTFSFWGLQNLQMYIKSSSVAFLLSTLTQGQWYHPSQASQKTQTTVPLGLRHSFSPMAQHPFASFLPPIVQDVRILSSCNSTRRLWPTSLWRKRGLWFLEHYAFFSIVYYFDSSSSLGSWAASSSVSLVSFQRTFLWRRPKL